MITAIIIDDEQHCIDWLQQLITTHFSGIINITAVCTTYEAGIAAIQQAPPELVFLDVQLQDKTGIALAEELRNLDLHIIFTTGHEQYAVQAFRLSAVDYLLKPVALEDLQAAIAKVKEQLSRNDLATRFEALYHNLKNIRGGSKRICIPVFSGLELIEMDDIVRCESEINYTWIYLKNKQKLFVSKTLKEFETMLNDYDFFRIHNSHLVNLRYVRSYKKGKGGTVVMTDDSEIEVSVRRKDAFMKKLATL
jgi:two-component system LytT family response regulator